MHAIQRVLAALRRLILGNSLVRACLRGLLFLVSVLARATKKRRSSAPKNGSPNIRIVYPEPDDTHECDPGYERNVISASASLVSASLHPRPYLHASPRASRSYQDITQLPTRVSDPLRSLSAPHLPATGSNPNSNPPPDTSSVRHSPTPPPSPHMVQSDYLRPTNVHNAAPPTESPAQSRRGPIVDGMASAPLLNEAYPRIFPGIPESIGRYDRRGNLPNDKPTKFTIPALAARMDPAPAPPGWTSYLHPEGARYFFHHGNRVFTDANLSDPELLEFVDTYMRIIQDFIQIHRECNVDLVLEEYIYSDGSRGCQYYFANHVERRIFWIDKVESDIFPVSFEVPGITSNAHIGHELEAQYWYHCELFPKSLQLAQEVVDELRDVVFHSLGDFITSDTSTITWKVEELNHMLQLIDIASKNVGGNADSKFSGASCVIGRLMHSFARARVYNFHGEPCARLDVSQPLNNNVRRTWLIRLLSPLLFLAPDFHLNGLRRVYADHLTRSGASSQMISRLVGEWQEVTLYATVMLNVDVAFLSIQSVDQNGVLQARRTPQQISSYLSMLTSIGAIIIGLALLKLKRDGVPITSALHISHRRPQTRGLETLAVLYSLPSSMLIWSMLSFLAAFFFMCFEDSSLITRVLVAALGGVLFMFIFFFTRWEGTAWRLLRDLSCGKGDKPEDENSSGGDDNDQSAPAYSQPLNRWWGWLSIMLQKGSVDRDRTGV